MLYCHSQACLFFPVTDAEVFVSPLPVAEIFPICKNSSQHHCQIQIFEKFTAHMLPLPKSDPH